MRICFKMNKNQEKLLSVIIELMIGFVCISAYVSMGWLGFLIVAVLWTAFNIFFFTLAEIFKKRKQGGRR